MKELFDLLEKSERKVLILLCLLLAVAVIFHQGFAVKQKKTFRYAVQSQPTLQKELANIEESNKNTEMEWQQWQDAEQDIAAIEKKYFYKENKNVNRLRLDLRKIFQQAGIRVTSDLFFDWADWEETRLKKVRVRFTLAGPYGALKRFIHQVEIHPKFLMIERIDFRDIDTQTGRIELQIELAGYYEN
jgi:cell division protein FtsB